MFRQKYYFWLATLILCVFGLQAQALEYSIPPKGKSLIGQFREVYSEPGDTISTVGQRYNVGYVELREANPRIHPERIIMDWTKIKLPTHFILPAVPRRGVVINLAELRMYHYLPGNKVITVPVGIGREGWQTPIGKTTVRRRVRNPAWYPPKSVREEAALTGHHLPRVVPPGPDNPLGKFAMRLGWPGYLIHSTNRPEGVGRRSSAGCIRMYPPDAERFYNLVRRGTPVRVVNQPYKAGWEGDTLYFEAHFPLQEDILDDGSELAPAVEVILDIAKRKGGYYRIDWEAVRKEAVRPSGIPVAIGQVYKPQLAEVLQ